MGQPHFDGISEEARHVIGALPHQTEAKDNADGSGLMNRMEQRGRLFAYDGGRWTTKTQTDGLLRVGQQQFRLYVE